jgi:hypothetical protein
MRRIAYYLWLITENPCQRLLIDNRGLRVQFIGAHHNVLIEELKNEGSFKQPRFKLKRILIRKNYVAYIYGHDRPE